MESIHDRMPVLVPTESWNTWLNSLPQPDEVLLPILKPFAPNEMQLWAVSSVMGNVANQGEELIRPSDGSCFNKNNAKILYNIRFGQGYE